MTDIHGRPQVRDDGCVLMHSIPAGFLKVTKAAINRFMRAFPQLTYGPDQFALNIDLFNHGAHEGVWYGEDYAFARRWRECGGQIWCVPDLNLDHHTKDGVFVGNYHEYLLRLPGGSESDNPIPPRNSK